MESSLRIFARIDKFNHPVTGELYRNIFIAEQDPVRDGMLMLNLVQIIMNKKPTNHRLKYGKSSQKDINAELNNMIEIEARN